MPPRFTRQVLIFAVLAAWGLACQADAMRSRVDAAVGGAADAQTDTSAAQDRAWAAPDGLTLQPISDARSALSDGPLPTPDSSPGPDAVSIRDAPPHADADAAHAADLPGDAMGADRGASADADRAADLAHDALDSKPTDTIACPLFSGGSVSADLTLNPDCGPYIITDDIDVENDATLVLLPGVTLQFAPGTKLLVGWTDPGGRLVAQGTATLPITLTSAASPPGAGDWRGVSFGDFTSNESVMGYVSLRYCGDLDTGSCIEVGSGVPAKTLAIQHASIRDPGHNGIVLNGDATQIPISDETFAGVPATGYAISSSASAIAGIGPGNTFNGSRIEITGGVIAQSATWITLGTICRVTEDIAIEGDQAPVLTIQGGNRFEFASGKGLDIGWDGGGGLVVQGTAQSPVVFTSATARPVAGDWNGISFFEGSVAGSSIDHAEISYAGANSGGDVNVAGSGVAVSLSNSTLTDSAGYGVQVDCDALPPVMSTILFSSNALGDTGPGPNCP